MAACGESDNSFFLKVSNKIKWRFGSIAHLSADACGEVFDLCGMLKCITICSDWIGQFNSLQVIQNVSTPVIKCKKTPKKNVDLWRG